MTHEELRVGDKVDFCSKDGFGWHYGEVVRTTPKKVTFILPNGSFTHNLNAKVAVLRTELLVRATELGSPVT